MNVVAYYQGVKETSLKIYEEGKLPEFTLYVAISIITGIGAAVSLGVAFYSYPIARWYTNPNPELRDFGEIIGYSIALPIVIYLKLAAIFSVIIGGACTIAFTGTSIYFFKKASKIIQSLDKK